MSSLRTRHGVLLLIVGPICLIGWGVIQAGPDGARPIAAQGVVTAHLPTAVYGAVADTQPGSVLPTSFLEAAGNASRKLEIVAVDGNPFERTPLHLNYDDVKKGYTVKVTGFTLLTRGGVLLIRDEDRETVFRKELEEDEEQSDTERTFKKPAVDRIIGRIAEHGVKKLVAIWRPNKVSGEEKDPPEQTSEVLEIQIDTQGPVLDAATLIGDPAIGMTLVLSFTGEDLRPESARDHNNYVIERAKADGSFEVAYTPTDDQITPEGNVVRISLGRVVTGNYRVTVKGTLTETEAQAGTKPLSDIVGNFAGGRGSEGKDQMRSFSSYPEREKGERIEFPEYLPTARQPKTERRANPSDFVETRVVHLYYFRDAHRVAQLLNRTTKSLNRAAVDQARRRAESARKKADELTDERRHKQREAVRAAEELRRVENQLADQRDQLSAANNRAATVLPEIDATKAEIANVEKQMADLRRAIDALNERTSSVTRLTPYEPRVARLPLTDGAGAGGRPYDRTQRADGVQHLMLTSAAAADTPSKDELENQLSQLQAKHTDLRKQLQEKQQALTALGIPNIQGRITDLESRMAVERDQAVQLNEESLQATAKEDRAREEQFRLEVGAAHEDPDTYAAAKADSVDPVAQVSISVIGEGVLQLRGPRKGLDKIRTMIHRIDSPLGQVKVDIVTVQLNGERGDRMEKPVGLVDAHLGLGRFLTAQSLLMLRRAIQVEAASIAMQNDQGGHYQIDRDRKYLYGFYGRDFVDELYEMDSEFLRTENKMLSLHSMDTISLHRALFTLALAKNDVRQRILCNFMQMVQCELPRVEFDYRRSSELRPHRSQKYLPPWNRARLPVAEKQHREECTQEAVMRNARQRYHFRNLRGFFATDVCEADTMNAAQREFIRLAQIFKARMIAELELKQRVMERALVEDDREASFVEEEAVRTSLRSKVLDRATEINETRFGASDALANAMNELRTEIIAARHASGALAQVALNMNSQQADEVFGHTVERITAPEEALKAKVRATDDLKTLNQLTAKCQTALEQCWRVSPRTLDSEQLFAEARSRCREVEGYLDVAEASFDRLASKESASRMELDSALYELMEAAAALPEAVASVSTLLQECVKVCRGFWDRVESLGDRFTLVADVRKFDWKRIVIVHRQLVDYLDTLDRDDYSKLCKAAAKAYSEASKLNSENVNLENARYFLAQTRAGLDRNKLLDHLIDERQEKYIDILEGTRAHIASMDNYLKRLAISLEDDFKVQFYDPAFVRIREAARQWDVTLGVVERTSILTNNRALAKVQPQATMEFDLPKRDIMIKEAMDGAKALTQDMGALLNDPTFLAAFKMMGGGGAPTKVQNVMPGLPSTTDEQRMGVTQGQRQQFGAALEALIPDPAIYKFETGTGYEIRPVIQPDGNSIVYDFMYMYTTNIREPVRADEKHLGRVKRHFINTQVQTSSFELREISRYQVALKAARTSQGVPLLQDIPGIGLAFRPLPSAESSIQQNVILGHSVVYPTLFDLMGLRWAPSVVDLNDISVRDSEHVVRGRYDTLTNSIFDTTSRRVDEMLDIQQSTPEHYRPDLHHRHTQPSPYHPGGYTMPEADDLEDPSGRGFEVPDSRPSEWRDPPYDPRFRNPIRYEQMPYPESPQTGVDVQQSRLPGIRGPAMQTQREDTANRLPSGGETGRTAYRPQRANSTSPDRRTELRLAPARRN